MNHILSSLRYCLVLSHLSWTSLASGQFQDKSSDLLALPKGASCAKCHSVDRSTNEFGPNLSDMGLRSKARHIVQSIVEPNTLITEGFNQQTVISNSTPRSNSMPTGSSFGVEEQKDRLRISLDGKPIVDFVFQDEKILRPYFANARLANGLQVTRNHPPIEGEDALDHDTMHPGVWLGAGDINGQDYWRNKASMEHIRFVAPPKLEEGRLQFATECQMRSKSGEPVCLLTNEFALAARPTGWLLRWTATFRADQGSIVFGDQEEMGFGARIATPFTEKSGGVIRSSTGKKTAEETWGQPAKWCDYSGSGQHSGGIMLMASDNNFRESWWHNRDYGVFVANPFGRESMKQGPRSTLTIAQGESLKVSFGALIHDEEALDTDVEFKAFQELP